MTIYYQMTACLNEREEEIFTTAEIKRKLNAKYATKEGSVIPSDYCYNHSNKGRALMDHSIFEKIGHGKYRYLGPGYPYTGNI
ncbi:MAG: hypothetical protein ABSH41_14585 [Syntrophobacteraceae bacterium]|jgi:hypothetical protein